MPKFFKNTELCKIRTVTAFVVLSEDRKNWEGQIKEASFFL
jgi:hypothetical protein